MKSPRVDSSSLLLGKVCIVTGATRGVGRGIALQLGAAGAIVYITGRTLTASESSNGSLEETAREVEARGGRCIPVQCDHSNDKDIEELFEKVEKEQKGRLDLLVNNAYSAINFMLERQDQKFYQMTPEVWDLVNNVGLRNYYICSVYAARLMVKQKRGLIVFLSSPGGIMYLFHTAYGVGKAAVDRMAADMGVELRESHVTCVSLWPCAVRTDTVMASVDDPNKLTPGGKQFQETFENGETPEFVGKAVAALLKENNVMKYSGKILLTTDLAIKYGFRDIDGRMPVHFRSVRLSLELTGHRKLAKITPKFLKIPKWVVHMSSNKF